MEDNNVGIKKPKKLIRTSLIIAIIVVCLFLLGGSTVVIMKLTIKAVSKAVKDYINNVTINENGSITVGSSAEDLWARLKREGYDLDAYLNSTEELEYLMNAELVTQLPYLEVNEAPKNLDSAEADSLYYIQQSKRGYPVPGGSSNENMVSDSVSMVMSLILLTGDYSITPNSIQSEAESKYGASKVNTVEWSKQKNTDVTIIKKMCAEKYGLKYKNLSSRKRNAESIKKILNGGHVVCVGGNNLTFYKEDGSSRVQNGHTVMFYKYKDGIFYAKDSASDGGAMCPYTEKQADTLFKNAEYITEYSIKGGDIVTLSNGDTMGPQSSDCFGYTSKEADDLIFIQQRSKGAKGNIASNKEIECGWVSLTHSLILVTGDYTLTPEKLAKMAQNKYGKNFTNKYSYVNGGYSNNGCAWARKIAKDLFGRKIKVRNNLTTNQVKSILKSGGVIMAYQPAGKNTQFYKPDGSHRSHPSGHTIMFYKYENGYFYAKDSTPSDGGTRCKFPQSYTKIFSGYNLVIY